MKNLIYWGRKAHLFAAKGPAYHYTYGRWRFGNWLQKISLRSFTLDKVAFLAALNLENPALSQVKRTVDEGKDESALIKLTTYFRTRVTPLFFFNEQDNQSLISLIPKDQQEATICTANQICQNIFQFRRTAPVKFEDAINWTHHAQENLDWTWDLNRHTYFETLGRAYWYTSDERYAQKFRALLLDWLANNPAIITQPTWASVFEVAFRINTWIWAFYYFRSAAAFDAETCLAFLQGLLAHGRYLSTNLELHSQNNHLLLEAKSLALLGILFPEFKEAHKWQQQGLKILYEQIEAQVCSDGVHGERATHYHRVIAGELLELLLVLENNNLPVPANIIETFGRMVEFEMWVTKPDGLIPLLGDSALADTHLRFPAVKGGSIFLRWNKFESVASSLDEATIWLLGCRRVSDYLNSPATTFALSSRAFPEGGYFVMRSSRETEVNYLVFDCGPFCYKFAPAHGHADALSFELHALGQTMLIDPGIYSTHLGKNWRNFFRGSRAHNTVVVDDQDQSILMDTWRVYRPAQATLHQWLTENQFDFVDGSHNGYERLPNPITHRRQIFFIKPEYWIIIDVLTGRGEHCFDSYFHLMPGVEPQLEPLSGIAWAGDKNGPGLIIAPLATSHLQADIIVGSTAPIQGWVSFFSGEKLPAAALRYRQVGPAPVQFCTLLYPYSAQPNPSAIISPLEVETHQQLPSAELSLTGLRIETEAHVDYLVVDRGPAGSRKSFAGYETDGQLAYIRCRKEDHLPAKVITTGGCQLLFHGSPLMEQQQP